MQAQLKNIKYMRWWFLLFQKILLKNDKSGKHFWKIEKTTSKKCLMSGQVHFANPCLLACLSDFTKLGGGQEEEDEKWIIESNRSLAVASNDDRYVSASSTSLTVGICWSFYWRQCWLRKWFFLLSWSALLGHTPEWQSKQNSWNVQMEQAEFALALHHDSSFPGWVNFHFYKEASIAYQQLGNPLLPFFGSSHLCTFGPLCSKSNLGTGIIFSIVAFLYFL